ncbi:hypothetical protein Mgra_00002141 [Meloidogyne graminicola]|uniref:Uncharacterized protein n=1 Tax=Meloidogyne graminicola TaxID=189291 RepID=A0A8S9ZZY6_9BILA|nr:hypothetical protein Mgra_00002141 [Meloidogyne graminicola]
MGPFGDHLNVCRRDLVSQKHFCKFSFVLDYIISFFLEESLICSNNSSLFAFKLLLIQILKIYLTSSTLLNKALSNVPGAASKGPSSPFGSCVPPILEKRPKKRKYRRILTGLPTKEILLFLISSIPPV